MTPPAWLETPSGLVRARGLGIPFTGDPGPLNAITDVPGVAVGYRTIVEGDATRTGATVLLPRGRDWPAIDCTAGWFSLNGNGEMTGTTWIEETGRLALPIAITNTHAVGRAHSAVVRYIVEHERRHGALADWHLPVVAETWDGHLNDPFDVRVTEDDVLAALGAAAGGALEEGSVGGGTGMIAFGYKGGSGTASRLVETRLGTEVLGAFVQANFGSRDELRIGGLRVGARLGGHDPWQDAPEPSSSVIVVLATTAPLLPAQCKALARRCSLGIGRVGGFGGITSGDIFLAFSTAEQAAVDHARARLEYLAWDAIDPLYAATVDVVEEAILNALCANRSMVGYRGREVVALPHDAVRRILADHGLRAAPPTPEA